MTARERTRERERVCVFCVWLCVCDFGSLGSSVHRARCQEEVNTWDFQLASHGSLCADVATSRMRCVLFEFHKQSVETFKDKLALVISPSASRAVRVTKPIAKGELQLVPMALQVNATKGGQSVPSGSVDLGVGFTHPTNGDECLLFVSPEIQTADGQPTTAVAGPTRGPSKEPTFEFLVPVWLVASTLDSSQGNMQMHLFDCEAMGGRHHIPCCTNTKGLKVGDELRVYVKTNNSRYPSFKSLFDKLK